MRLRDATALAAALLLSTACAKGEAGAPATDHGPVAQTAPAAAGGAPKAADLPSEPGRARAVIRDAKLDVVVAEPQKAAAELSALVERKGGFVSSTDTTSPGKESEVVTVGLRAPAAEFQAILEGTRRTGRVLREEVRGKDVTEELVDLDARLRAQRAVEAQYLEILRQAKTVPDLLEVQKKLGEARADIERAEGRKRFLEDQVALSTFQIVLRKEQTASQVGADTPFSQSASAAARDFVLVVRGATHLGIRAVGVLLPIALFFGVPTALIVLWQRRKRRVLASA